MGKIPAIAERGEGTLYSLAREPLLAERNRVRINKSYPYLLEALTLAGGENGGRREETT